MPTRLSAARPAACADAVIPSRLRDRHVVHRAADVPRRQRCGNLHAWVQTDMTFDRRLWQRCKP